MNRQKRSLIISTNFGFQEYDYTKSVPALRADGFSIRQIMALLDISEQIVLRYKWADDDEICNI